MTLVVIGILQYNSNVGWLSLPYYAGLHEDHDMTFKIAHCTDSFQRDLAYFYQSEPDGPTDAFDAGGSGCYSYDVIPVGNVILSLSSNFESIIQNIKEF